MFKRDVIEREVLRQVEAYLANPKAPPDTSLPSSEESRDRVQAIARLGRQIERTLKLYAEADKELEGEILAQLETLQAQRNELQLAQQQAEPPSRSRYADLVAETEGLDGADALLHVASRLPDWTREQQKRLLRRVVKSVRVWSEERVEVEF